MIEYNRVSTDPWLARCLTCGCLVQSGDTEIHSKWHDSLTNNEGETE